MKFGVTLIFFNLLSCLILVHASANEKRLIKDLFRDYEKLERPVANESIALVLKHGLTLRQIIDVDIEKQILTSNIWQSFEWTDENLKWDPSEYGNIEDIRVLPQNIWIPDVIPYNTVDYSQLDPKQLTTNVVVKSDGAIIWIHQMALRSTCRIDSVYLSSHEQTCDIKFGSWTYDGYKLNLQSKSSSVDISSYVRNEDWDLVGFPANRHEIFYECCPEPYIDITYEIKIKKRQTTLGGLVSWF